MKKITINIAIGLATVVYGIWRIFTGLVKPLHSVLSAGNFDTFDVVMLSLISLMYIPLGGGLIYFGVRLAKENNKTNIKGIASILSISGVLLLAGFIRHPFEEFEPATSLSMLLATLLVIPIYIFITKYWMRATGLSPVKSEFIGSKVVYVIVLQIWLVSVKLIDEFAPIKEGYTYVKKEPWGLIYVVGPILLACIFGKIAMMQIKKMPQLFH